jgi:hypothetical protein
MFDSIESVAVQRAGPALPLQSTKPEPFRPRAFFRCVTLGHDMVASRSHPGRITCRRCRLRRTY